MKLTTYKPQVQLNTIGDARVVVPGGVSGGVGVPHAIAGIGKAAQANVFGALAQGVDTINKELIRQQEEQDTVNVIAANTEYRKRVNDVLYNPENGLMNTRMQGAANISETFMEAERKIREEVGGEYKFHTKKGGLAFQNRANLAAIQQYELVRRHQFQQYNAYKDVTFNNNLTLNIQEAANHYDSPDLVEQNMKDVIALSMVRTNGQGEEVIRAATQKAGGTLISQVISRAYANGDYAQAEAYLAKYNSFLTAEQKTSLQKSIVGKARQERDYSDIVSLAKQYKDLPTFLQKVNEAYDATHGSYDDYNMPTQGANIDEQVKQLTPAFRNALPQIGGILKNRFHIDAVISSGGRTREHQMEINPSAPNSYHVIRENGGDAVDIVLPDSVSDAQAEQIKQYFKGTGAFAEVLFHDAGSGYHLHLGGYQGGLSHKGTEGDRQQYINNALAEYKRQHYINNQLENSSYEGMNKELMELRDAGSADWKAYTDIVERISGDNPNLRHKGYNAARYWWGQVVGGTGSGTGSGSRSNPWGGPTRGGKSLDFGIKQKLEQALTYHDFETKSDWSSFVMQYHPSKEEYASLMNMYDNKLAGKGSFAYDWSGMEKSFKEAFPKLSDAEEAIAWRNAKTFATQQMNKLKAEKNREATDEEVLGFLIDSMTTVNAGDIVTPRPIIPDKKETYAPTKGRLSREDVQTVEVKPSGQVEVTMGNGVKYLLKDTEAFREAVATGRLRNRNR